MAKSKYFPPTSSEIHSFGIGFMDGVSGKKLYKSIETARTEFEDVDKEPHYYRAGYFLTNRVKWLAGAYAALNLDKVAGIV